MSKTDIFGPVEDNSDENTEEKVEEEEEPEEEEEKEGVSSRSKKEQGEADDDDEPDPWRLLHEKVVEDLEEPTWKKSKVPGQGKDPRLGRDCRFEPVKRRRLQKTYLGRLKSTHPIKFDAIRR